MILEKMLKAEGIIFASPNYINQITASMKALWDRASHFIHCRRFQDKYVSAIAVALDLETNLGIEIEVRRKILDKHGNRFSEDMIHTTGLAAVAVAYRNAVLRIIPRAIKIAR